MKIEAILRLYDGEYEVLVLGQKFVLTEKIALEYADHLIPSTDLYSLIGGLTQEQAERFWGRFDDNDSRLEELVTKIRREGRTEEAVDFIDYIKKEEK